MLYALERAVSPLEVTTTGSPITPFATSLSWLIVSILYRRFAEFMLVQTRISASPLIFPWNFLFQQSSVIMQCHMK